MPAWMMREQRLAQIQCNQSIKSLSRFGTEEAMEGICHHQIRTTHASLAGHSSIVMLVTTKALQGSDYY